MSTTQQAAATRQLPDPAETPVDEYAPGELYDELGPSRFRDAVETGVDTGDAVVVPASAVDEPAQDTDDDGGLARTAAVAYLRARNAVMRPAYALGRARVDGDAPDADLAERESLEWRPRLAHYAPLIAGAGAAAAHAAAGDPDLAVTTAEVAAGYAGKWTAYNADAARHAGERGAAREELAARERDDLAAADATVRVVPDDTYETLADTVDPADPREAEDAIAGDLD